MIDKRKYVLYLGTSGLVYPRISNWYPKLHGDDFACSMIVTFEYIDTSLYTVAAPVLDSSLFSQLHQLQFSNLFSWPTLNINIFSIYNILFSFSVKCQSGMYCITQSPWFSLPHMSWNAAKPVVCEVVEHKRVHRLQFWRCSNEGITVLGCFISIRAGNT